MLPLSVERCPGRDRKVEQGEWPFPRQDQDCGGCARKRQAVADYLAGTAGVVWMEPPEQAPCPERLEGKNK